MTSPVRDFASQGKRKGKSPKAVTTAHTQRGRRGRVSGSPTKRGTVKIRHIVNSRAASGTPDARLNRPGDAKKRHKKNVAGRNKGALLMDNIKQRDRRSVSKQAELQKAMIQETRRMAAVQHQKQAYENQVTAVQAYSSQTDMMMFLGGLQGGMTMEQQNSFVAIRGKNAPKMPLPPTLTFEVPPTAPADTDDSSQGEEADGAADDQSGDEGANGDGAADGKSDAEVANGAMDNI